MYPWRNKFSLPALLWPGFLVPLFLSCGFADLRPIGVSVFPGVSGTVLPDYYSPVILRFDTEMEKTETGKIIQISSAAGLTEGDLRWEGNDLYFTPLGGWNAGTRYMLSMAGTIYASDGRELRLAKYLPFFAVFTPPAPRLESFSPGDGASVDIYPGEGGILELRFSLPMDRRSTELALTLEGPGEKCFEWLEDDRILRISAPGALLPWTVFHWTLSDRAQSREGIFMVKAVSARFITGEDRLIPRVLRVFPVRYSGGTWQPRGDNLETGPGSGEAIGLEFNKAMDGESLLHCLRFEPSVSGRVEQPGSSLLIFIPDRDPEPETVYILRVSGDTKDAGGLRMGADYTASFIPDIPFLKIHSLTVDGSPVVEMEDPERKGALPVSIDVPGGGVLRFALKFSLPFTGEARVAGAFRISLEPFFPDTLPFVKLRFAYWFSDDCTLRMEWEGLKTGDGEGPHYYRLNIPGGRNGVGTGEGSFLREDTTLYLEVSK